MADGSTTPLSPDAQVNFKIINWSNIIGGWLESPAGGVGPEISGVFQHVHYISPTQLQQYDSLTYWIYAEVLDDGSGNYPNPPLSGIVKVNVKSYCVVVTLSPSKLGLGDTASIILKKKLPGGVVADFSSGSLFDIQIIEGQNYGTLLSSNGLDTADAFTGIPQGMKFIASNSINPDSVVVKIVATITSGSPQPKQAKQNKVIQGITNGGTCAPGEVMIKKGYRDCTDNPVVNLGNLVQVDNNSGCDHSNGGGSSRYALNPSDLIAAGGSNDDIGIGLCHNNKNNCTRVQLTNFSPPFMYGVCRNSQNLHGVDVTSWDTYLSPTKEICKLHRKEIEERMNNLLDKDRSDLGVNFKSLAFEDEILAHEKYHQKYEKEYLKEALHITLEKPPKECLSNEEVNNFYTEWRTFYQFKFLQKISEKVDMIKLREGNKYGWTTMGQIRRDELYAQKAQAEKLKTILKQWPDCRNLQ